ncbi:nad binding rossmann fold-containing protein [Colletotrichum truncatum]|uniref:Nad binding rossmann fold-containing protein n=1 Tax=Colletotrichum truncatum TaxID=5467 RepID=A0ACC3YK24_COLTU|nr:nad binding rossmann fold-containing protein [Colletotrichum truncatum]KAF6784316.1 nad binding rossmann fold-containing protein [Colletotrichum truncatum]
MSSPPKVLKVGVVGIGRMGQRHALNVLRLVPGAKLICACSPAQADLDWASINLEPYGVKVYQTFEEMIETPGLEAVIISSITELHMPQTLAAFEKGIHVLCEKPICNSLSELEALCERVEAKPETKVMVAFVRRFDDSYQDAYANVKSGTIGKPFVFRSHGAEKLDQSPFFHQYLAKSGGIYFDSAIHDIDLALMFLGEDSVPKSVSAIGTAEFFPDLKKTGDADNAIGVCEFWDGKMAHFYHSRSSAVGYDNVTEIFGTAGKLTVNATPRRNRVEICDSDGVVKVEPTASWYERYMSAFVVEANAFVDAILNGQEMPIPLRSAITSLRIAGGLQESLRSGQKVHFNRQGLVVGPNAQL